MEKRLFLLGKKLSHSMSPQIFMQFGLPYALRELDSEEAVRAFVLAKEYDGLNVTIPYKQTVIPLLDEISAEAAAIGAVNTIVNRNGKLYGYNTDVAGMRYALRREGINPYGRVCAVLGSGGTSKTAHYVLSSMGASECLTVSRSGKINYENVYSHKEIGLILNTTPVGMYPNIDAVPIALTAFEGVPVFDCVYNPLRTLLVQRARQGGAIAGCGLAMLAEQARCSKALFLSADGEELSLANCAPQGYGEATPFSLNRQTEQLADYLTHRAQNVVLIGMPSCGKSTLGAAVAAALNRPFYDTDSILTDRYGDISQLILRDGEASFREKESAVVRELSVLSGVVIATGGGVPLREDNYRLLKCNGRLVWIKRNVHLLETQGRPLSQKGSLAEMEQKRTPYYLAAADCSMENNGEISKAVDTIVNYCFGE